MIGFPENYQKKMFFMLALNYAGTQNKTIDYDQITHNHTISFWGR